MRIGPGGRPLSWPTTCLKMNQLIGHLGSIHFFVEYVSGAILLPVSDSIPFIVFAAWLAAIPLAVPSIFTLAGPPEFILCWSAWNDGLTVGPPIWCPSAKLDARLAYAGAL